MKNASLNIATAPVMELPDNVRIPLHSLQADLEYLIGRVIADSSCGPMVAKSMRERLDKVEQFIRANYREPWECMGRKQALPEPGECNWPDCGCDPHATKVIESLIEQGWNGPQ